MRGLYRLMLAWVAATGLLAATPAWAQLTVLAPSEAVKCLMPAAEARGEPAYPPMLLKSGRSGRVKATTTFRGTDWSLTPTISIISQEGGDEFVEAVKAHLGKLRVPCLPRDGQATLTFDVVFNPRTERVYWNEPVDLADEARSQLLKCAVSVKGEKLPSYPELARREMRQGRIWAEVRFDSADQPPKVKLHHRPSATPLAVAAEKWLESRRLPCYAGEPINAEIQFIFVIEGSVFGFKPLTLVQYMGYVKDIQRQTVSFDTHSMGCPFDLRLTYRQPELPNRVGELGERNPARQSLLTWLAGTTLRAQGNTLDSVYADTADITVPCVKIDLKPKE
jgi:hypothetical protein